jgi:quercetin dioxygenase-like cupin family protein
MIEVALKLRATDHAVMDATEAPTTSAGYVLPSGQGERIWIVGDTMTTLASAAGTGGSLTVELCEAAPGGGPPPHVHTREDEFFYVLDGEFEWLIGEQTHRGGPGTFAFVGRGTVHRFSCIGDRPGRILVGFTPGGMDGFFRASGRPAVDDGPAPAVDADEIARTEAAAERFGMRIAGWS